MEKRVFFRQTWMPWVLIAPQMIIVSVFFFWPAGQALFQSLIEQDAFGTSIEFVGWQNFQRLFADPSYLASFSHHGRIRWFGGLPGAIGFYAAGCHGRSCGARCSILQNHADLALCRGSGGGWGVMAVHVCFADGRGVVCAATKRHTLEPSAQLRSCHGPDRHGGSMETNVL